MAMAIFITLVFAFSAGFWLGGAHERWLWRNELRGLRKRIREYTGGGPSKPW